MAPEQPAEEWEEARDSVVDEWDVWGRNAYDFLKRHARGAVYQIPDRKMNSTKFNAPIRFMVRLYFCLSKFVDFYPTFARSNAVRPQPVFPPVIGMDHRVQEDQEWPPLTETERLRLQRGLLRYEMFCRLIGIPSVVASCNRDICDAVITRRGISSRIWLQNIFSGILPIDEVEEIVCASIYVRYLYHSLRWSSLEEFHNHVLSLSQGRGDSVLDNGGGDIRKTAEYWLSHTQDQILDFGSLGTYGMFDWTESVSRLGLVFLHRMTKSTPAERRDLMRSAFNNILELCHDSFLWCHWDDVVNGSFAPNGIPFGFGPHCNSMVQTSSSNNLITYLMNMRGGTLRLRRLGWVFFDDRSKLRSLGIPHHATVSTMRAWLNKAENRDFNQHRYEREIPHKVLETLFTEQEWKELVMKKYTPKDRRGDYQSMSQFVAGARAVVDFSSNQLPRLD